MSWSIEQVVPPASVDAPDAGPFLDLVAVRNAVEAEVLGTDLVTATAAELLPEFRDNPTRRRTHLVARVDGVAVGRSMTTTRPHTPGAGAYLSVDVLPDHRRRGIGTALLAAAEDAARDVGETTFKVSDAHSASTPGPRLAAPTGFGDVPADDPGVRLLLRSGYSLEQVVRISLLRTDGLAGRLDAIAPALDPAYAMHSWRGRTPERWLADVADLRTRMSVDAPMAGLVAEPDPWDADRVVAHDERIAAGGHVMATAAVEHVATGRLAGFSEMEVSSAHRAAIQEDTLVVREHRGHRLGLLLKISVARELLATAPHVEAVVTWNAEENRPMLDVNELMGFEAIGLEGGWQRRD